MPDAAMALAKALQISTGSARLRTRTVSRTVEFAARGWEVMSQDGRAITKPSGHRGQAEGFADLIWRFIEVDVPTLWMDGLGTIATIPLYGIGTAERWAGKVVSGSQ